MHTRCPHCQAELPRRDLFLRGVITCPTCQQKACFGNFWQWLTAGVAALACSLLILVQQTDSNAVAAIVTAVAAGLVGLMLMVIFVVKPVMYRKRRLFGFD